MLSQSLPLPDTLPSPCLAEQGGLQHSALCCDTEASGEGLAQGTGQNWALPPHRREQSQAMPAARRGREQSWLRGRAQPSSCCLRTGSCGCLLPKGVRPCCCPWLSLSGTILPTILPTTSSQLAVWPKQAVLLPTASHLKEFLTFPAFCYWIVFKLFWRFAMQFSCQV